MFLYFYSYLWIQLFDLKTLKQCLGRENPAYTSERLLVPDPAWLMPGRVQCAQALNLLPLHLCASISRFKIVPTDNRKVLFQTGYRFQMCSYFETEINYLWYLLFLILIGETVELVSLAPSGEKIKNINQWVHQSYLMFELRVSIYGHGHSKFLFTLLWGLL